MVSEDKLDVLVSFDDGGAKVFVALDNKELRLSPQVAKGFARMRVQVMLCLAADNALLEGGFEGIKASWELLGMHKGWGLPPRAEVEAGIEIMVGFIAGHECFDSQFFVKTGQDALFIVLPRGVESWGGDKLETVPQERAKVLGWWDAGGKVMEGHVGGPFEIE